MSNAKTHTNPCYLIHVLNGPVTTYRAIGYARGGGGSYGSLRSVLSNDHILRALLLAVVEEYAREEGGGGGVRLAGHTPDPWPPL